MFRMSEDIAVTKFREYLRVNTEQPKPDYAACQKFLYGLADELGIRRTSYEMAAGKPIVVMTIEGTHPQEPSLMLYSHTDVVPTFRDHWTHDPYSAHKDAEGRIYARGAQDMKCVGSQYFEALRRHFGRGKKQFRRTVHLVWGPDEEIGGGDGLCKFVHDPAFAALNIGFTLDEGIASENEVYKVFYAERAPWWIRVTFEGNPGHGSKFIENTAVEKLHRFMSLALAYREEQKAKLEGNSSLTLGDVTTLNITIISGGVQVNVVPEKLVAEVDIRVTPTDDHKAFDERLHEWCRKSGEGVHFEYTHRCLTKTVTPTTRDDKWWAAFEDTLSEQGCKFTKEIFTGATDSRYIREKGIRSIGFSPMNNIPSLLHDHNEYITESLFLRGVQIYEKLIEKLADLA